MKKKANSTVKKSSKPVKVDYKIKTRYGICKGAESFSSIIEAKKFSERIKRDQNAECLKISQTYKG